MANLQSRKRLILLIQIACSCPLATGSIGAMCRKCNGGRTRWKACWLLPCERKLKWMIETSRAAFWSRQPDLQWSHHWWFMRGRMTIHIRGTAALLVAAAIVAATAIWLPAYRWFLVISIGIGLAVAGGLFLWHRLRPVKDEDIENKRPLGLS